MSPGTLSTCLHVAVKGYNVNNELLSHLLKHPSIAIDPREGCSRGRTPLMLASRNGYWKTMKLLIDAGADVNLKFNGNTLGHICLDLFDPTKIYDASICLSVVLESGLCPDATDGYGKTILFEAISKNNVHAMKIVIAANGHFITQSETTGTRINLENDTKIAATLLGNITAVKLLIKSGDTFCHPLPRWYFNMQETEDPAHSTLVQCLKELCLKPRTLKEISRTCIRSYLGYFPKTKASRLHIPSILRDYILLRDVVN